MLVRLDHIGFMLEVKITDQSKFARLQHTYREILLFIIIAHTSDCTD